MCKIAALFRLSLLERSQACEAICVQRKVTSMRGKHGGVGDFCLVELTLTAKPLSERCRTFGSAIFSPMSSL
jgi:hypothetical protein